MFHLDITKVDRAVARRGQWLSLCGGTGPTTDAGTDAGGGTWDVGCMAGYGCWSSTGVGATSRRPDARRTISTN